MLSKLQRVVRNQCIPSAYQVIKDKVGTFYIVGRIYACGQDGTYGSINKQQLSEIDDYKLVAPTDTMRELWLWTCRTFLTNIFIVRVVGKYQFVTRQLVNRNEIIEEEFYVREIK